MKPSHKSTKPLAVNSAKVIHVTYLRWEEKQYEELLELAHNAGFKGRKAASTFIRFLIAKYKERVNERG